METALTYESVLQLMQQQSLIFTQNLEMGIAKSRKEFENELRNSRKEFDRELRNSRREFDKKIGELTGTWGRFVVEMVRPKLIHLFQSKGIPIETVLQSVKGLKDGQEYYEIDLLLINTNVAVVVEIKSTLTVEYVNEHLERMERIKTIAPKRIDLSHVTLYGAVAGMIVDGDADKYAYRKGLYVLRQKGNIVEIVNDDKFQPKEWKTEY